jgi:putative colanic acid biosynthesis UDP-glucose lipid carrier transferase
MRVHTQGAASFSPSPGSAGWTTLQELADPLLAVGLYALLALALQGPLRGADLLLVLVTFSLMYPGRLPFTSRPGGLGLSVLGSWAGVFGGLLLFGIATGYAAAFDSRVLALWAIAVPLATAAVHTVVPKLAPRFATLSETRTALVVGATEIGKYIAQAIEQGAGDGQQRVVGYFDDRSEDRLGELGELRVLGRVDNVADYVKRHRVDVIYIALPMASQPRIVRLLEALRDTTATICFVPDIFVADLIQARVHSIAGAPVLTVCETPFVGIQAAQKRLLDLLVCFLALPLVAPLMLLIAAAIRLGSPGPAFFKQRRYGLNGEEILVWKFRTMKVMEDGDASYKQVTRDDDRVTPIGRLLRKTSLDELPQLINVLTGSMSIVGPRPHAVAVNEQYRKLIPGYMVRHKVKPGITGWAQVNGYRGGDDLDSMRKRIEHDLRYLRSWTIGLDVQIIWRTALMLLRGDPKAY